MKYRLQPEAADDLRQIFEYISRDSLQNAYGMMDRLEERMELIGDHPHAGSP